MNDEGFYIELKKSRLPLSQKWRFRARGRNNEILASSEAYRNERDARDTILLLFGTDAEIRVIK